MTVLTSSSNTVSLALLICGKMTGRTHAENGDYIDIYERFLQASLESHKATAVAEHAAAEPLPLWQYKLDPYHVFERQELPSEEKLNVYDGIIITGSPASAYEDVDWINKLVAFVQHVVKTKPDIKLIGICFGHQIIARALGGSCVQNKEKGWEVGPTPITLTNLGKQIFGVETINLEQMHRDHVPATGVPPSFHLLGASPKSGVHGMVRFNPSYPHSAPEPIPTTLPTPPTATPDPTPLTPTPDRSLLSNVHIFTVQGHPEWNDKIVTPLTEDRALSAIIPADIANEAIRRRAWRNDGVSVVGSVIWSILGF